MSVSPNPYAPPSAEVADLPVAGLEPGGRGARLGAVIIDIVVQMAVLWIASFIVPWRVFSGEEALNQLLLNAGLGLLLFVGVQGWLLVKRGQTIGKLALGLRITRPDGSPVGALRMLGLRYGIGYVLGVVPLLNIVYGLVDSLLIFRESRRCLHDNIADTIVVKA